MAEAFEAFELLIEHIQLILNISERKYEKYKKAHLLPICFRSPSKQVDGFSTIFCAIKSLGIEKNSKFGKINKAHLLPKCFPGSSKQVD